VPLALSLDAIRWRSPRGAVQRLRECLAAKGFTS
jgi:hypothetical protein